MPGTGYDRDAEKIGLNVSRGQRRLGLAVFVVSILVGMLLASWAKAEGALITGKGVAKDGDSVLIGSLELRLFGIDAPERDQECKRADRKPWPCGFEATRALRSLVDGKSLRCYVVEVEKTGSHRPIVRCYDSDTNISEEMIKAGFAWVFDRYLKGRSDFPGLKKLEADAQARRVGIWQGESQPPWEFRAQRWARYAARAPNGCPIIGNEKSRIYHTPWSRGYPKLFDGLVADPEAKGRRWFCDDRQAVAEGFRPSR